MSRYQNSGSQSAPGTRRRRRGGREGGRDELSGLRVDGDVPAEQNAADDLPSVRVRLVQVDGGGGGTRGIGLGHTWDCRRIGSRSGC